MKKGYLYKLTKILGEYSKSQNILVSGIYSPQGHAMNFDVQIQGTNVSLSRACRVHVNSATNLHIWLLHFQKLLEQSPVIS